MLLGMEGYTSGCQPFRKGHAFWACTGASVRSSSAAALLLHLMVYVVEVNVACLPTGLGTTSCSSLSYGRYPYLGIGTLVQPVGYLIEALVNDAKALAHLLQPHQVPVVAVPVTRDGNVELHATVRVVRLCLAQVPIDTAGAQNWTRAAPVPGLVHIAIPTVEGEL